MLRNSDQKSFLCFVCTALSVESGWIQRIGKCSMEVSLTCTDDLASLHVIHLWTEVRFTLMHDLILTIVLGCTKLRTCGMRLNGAGGSEIKLRDCSCLTSGI